MLPHENALIEGAEGDGVTKGWRLIEVVFEIDPCVALTVAVCAVFTAATKAAKLALEEPEGTKTEAGTETALLVLARLTVVPALGAGALKLTVHGSDPVPVIDEVLQLSPVSETEEVDPLP